MILTKLLFVETKILHVYSFFNFVASLYRLFNKSFSASEFTDNTGFLEFTLKFLKRSFNVFALFNWYNNHADNTSFS